ncbi:MAG: hypothetical protein HKP59_03005 [Lutibacter sp.]|uniref:hypothetical protein n=1 Tax=Lutibacter sp. TaxID=1925666 RepID=UPI0018060AB8|nr:hypothetical protein [Lutibacter sp.]MBT8316572.1 hypothetical protein [Lutibacter sp.]NNJ57432.1 hypothetical protein [Lutibacter sp.]
MKKIILLAIFLLSISYSCQTNDEFEILEANSFEFSVSTNDFTDLNFRNSETACFTTPLIAGQNYTAGRIDVEIVNEDGTNYVYISYITNDEWIIKLTHLYAGDREGIPETKKGNPKPGVFEKRMDYEANIISKFEVEYKIPAEAFEECFYIAAHSEVERIDDKGVVIQRETGWGQGEGFEGDSWAMYFEFCKNLCGDELTDIR